MGEWGRTREVGGVTGVSMDDDRMVDREVGLKLRSPSQRILILYPGLYSATIYI